MWPAADLHDEAELIPAPAAVARGDPADVGRPRCRTQKKGTACAGSNVFTFSASPQQRNWFLSNEERRDRVHSSAGGGLQA